jgi:sec-independent protein translocase protein TatC
MRQRTVPPAGRDAAQAVPEKIMSDYDEKKMTFTEHLGELRTRIIRSGIAIVIAVVVCYVFSTPIMELVARPLTPLQKKGVVEIEQDPEKDSGAETAEKEADKPARDEGATLFPETTGQWTVLNPLEMVLLKLKIAGYGGLLAAFPFLLWQVCAFIFPGLHPNERRVVQILIYGCSVLAVVGVLVAYFGVLPMVLPYLMKFVPEGWNVQLRASETISILIKILVGFAIAFQFPMGVLTLVYMELLTPATLKQYRKLAIVGTAFGAALLTPPDPVSMMVMMVPLVVLYESSIWLSYLVVRRRKKNAESRG